MDSVTNWLTSGWSDAWAQWQDPFTAVEDSVLSTAGLPTIPIAGSTEFPSTTGDASGGGTTTGTGSTSSFEPWAIGIGVLVLLFLVILLLHELESF